MVLLSIVFTAAILITISVLQTAILVFFALQLQRALKKYTYVAPENEALPSKDLPSVSVCIPARNETHAMAQCLERVLASDYEKLEIIVFDDGSSDDTSILIRSFAHAGVRFVPGKKLPEGWLGKNHALDVLAREASGTYALFLDVDTAVTPRTVSRMVDAMTARKLDMLSVIPSRDDTWRASVFTGTLRYFWRLVFSTRRRPASSCAAWMINLDVLLGNLGGFGSHKGDVQPEAHIAAQIAEGSYGCVISTPELGVSYEKRWSSQIETSRRLLYPMSGGTWRGGVVALAGLVLLNLPTFVIASGSIFGWGLAQVMAAWLLMAFMAVYCTYTARVWRRNWWLGGLLWPYVILQELVVYVRSMWGYSRRTITWKGRPVAAAVSRADYYEVDS